MQDELLAGLQHTGRRAQAGLAGRWSAGETLPCLLLQEPFTGQTCTLRCSENTSAFSPGSSNPFPAQGWAQPGTAHGQEWLTQVPSGVSALGESGQVKDSGLNEIIELDKDGMFLWAGISVSC